MKYTIGIDYGTLSARALLVETASGKEIATSVYQYPHGVMDVMLPSGKKLDVDWALQHPLDYIEALYVLIPEVLKTSGVCNRDVIGIGTDFTACSILPIKKDGTPLCYLEPFRDNPNAYVKLWKHHAAQDKANELNTKANERQEKWITRYGGKISSEWIFPKIMQIFDEAPEVYEAADKIIEAGDWLVLMLTGEEKRNSCAAGYKAIWHKREGYPSDDFFASLRPRMACVIDEKLSRDIYPLGTRAGGIKWEIAKRTGLISGTPVAVGHMDAHACIPAIKIDAPGKMLAIMGTSTCHLVMGKEEHIVPGMCGYVEDGMMPGYYGYEAGQSCVGDHFEWFVENCVPNSYEERAKEIDLTIHAYLQEEASKLKPGESGLVALDWWNGNRSVLVDADLSGVMVGMTLQTKPEEIYRALVEATAYGTRMIIDNFEKHGIPVDEFFASGGIAEKSPFMMQIYADVIKKPIRLSGSGYGCALGAAIFGAVAAGTSEGGYDDIFEATRKMGKIKEGVLYETIVEMVALYDALYKEFEILHDYFGRGGNDVMKRIKAIKRRNYK